MNKQDIAVVALLFLVLLGWMFHQNKVGRERLQAAAEQRELAQAETAALSAAAAASATLQAAPDLPTVAAEPAAADTPATPRATVQLVPLENEKMRVALSSHGGGLAKVELKNYPATRAAESAPVMLDFSDKPALALEGLPGLTPDADYTPDQATAAAEARFVARSVAGLVVERHITIDDEYRLKIQDRLLNDSAQPLTVSTNWLTLGLMHSGASKNDLIGGETIGIGERAKVQHFERDLLRAIGGGSGGCFGGGSRAVAPHASLPINEPIQWLAVKSRFFAQILIPDSPTIAGRVEGFAAPAGTQRNPVGSAAGAIAFAGFTLQPGEALVRTATLYVGPKKLAILTSLGPKVDNVMGFGTFAWVCKVLLPTLNFFYRIIPSYGIAIILLTVLVRVVFWPLTHKSTESMKRMQTLQPQLKALQAQYKNEPQKLQQETWRIYRENKVNPMSSCLPMLVQLPIFIALYTVLRSAVELRFADFLWIADLSEPENLLAGVLPIPLNILPILMALTMAVQSYLTPTAGDPAQQRMMMVLMPAMMLFMFYGMPSALSLYWTVSQGISIVQMLLQRYRNKKAGEAGGSAPPTIPQPATITRQMRRHP